MTYFPLNLKFCQRLEYDVEIVGDQVILTAQVQDLEKLERTKIPDNLIIEPMPIVAIVGAGAGNHCYLKCSD